MADLSSLLLLEYFILANVTFAGAALFYWAKPLSNRYNAWTTRLRERFPNINEPPSPKNAQLNFKIMFILFRVWCISFRRRRLPSTSCPQPFVAMTVELLCNANLL
jgi:hypothetical protein